MRATLAILTEPRTQANNYPTANIDPSSGRPFVAHGLEPENVDHEGIPQLPARSGPDCKPSANFPPTLFNSDASWWDQGARSVGWRRLRSLGTGLAARSWTLRVGCASASTACRWKAARWGPTPRRA